MGWGLGANSRMVPPRRQPRHGGRCCGPLGPGGLRHRRKLLTEQAGRTLGFCRWPHRHNPQLDTQPRVLRPDHHHSRDGWVPRTIRLSALETLRQGAPGGFDRRHGRRHHSAWGEATPTRAGLLQVLATSTPPPESACRSNALVGGWRGKHQWEANRNRSIRWSWCGWWPPLMLMPFSRVRLKRRPATAQAVRRRSSPCRLGADSESFYGDTLLTTGNTRMWRLDRGPVGGGGRERGKYQPQHGVERSAIPPMVGGGVQCVSELRAPASLRQRRAMAAAGGGRWLKGTLFAGRGRSETERSAGPETGLRGLLISCRLDPRLADFEPRIQLE